MQDGSHEVRTAWGFLAVRLPMPEDVQHPPQADNEEWQVGHDIPEVCDAQDRALVGKHVVCRILRDRRHEREECGDGDKSAAQNGDRARTQMPIFASKSAKSLAIRSAIG